MAMIAAPGSRQDGLDEFRALSYIAINSHLLAREGSVYVFERIGPLARRSGSGRMSTGGNAPQTDRSGGVGTGLAVAGCILAALLCFDGSAAMTALAGITLVAAGLAAVLRILQIGPASPLSEVPLRLALVLAGGMVWHAVTGADPATGLVLTALAIIVGRLSAPTRADLSDGGLALVLALMALVHRVG